MGKPLRLVITIPAQNDLDGIWDFIAQDSRQAADDFIDKIYSRFVPLAANPKLGSPRDELLSGLRSRAHGRYIVFYSFTKTELTIVRVLHGARDLSDIFDTDA